MKTNSRAVALAACEEWRNGTRFADAILGERLRASELDAADRAFATELFYGTLRNLMLLDFWIGQLRSGHVDHPSRDLLRLGLYQLFLLKTSEHAAVYETVDLADRRSRGLINAVLRNAVRRKTQLLEQIDSQNLSVRQSHPEFLIDRWTRNFGAEEAKKLCEWNNRPAPIYARINGIKISSAEFLTRYGEAEPSGGQPNFVRLPNVPNEALISGHCYIQDPSTATACTLLDPQPGDRVLDACAAPGGKTSYLAELMNNTGAILACDRDERRVETLRDNLHRLGANIAECRQHDWLGPKSAPARDFDRILIDAPCSNTGVMRRRVDVRWRLTPEDFSRMPQQQLRIARATIPLLKPGGILVYSTCSIEREENERVVEQILREFSFLKLLDQRSLLPFRDEFDGAYAVKLSRAL
ncbi:MAG: 16S rRNA (cytosine(967)-C(5))-methyltransferase RsmB [Chthoniobacterales bacterium]